MYDELLSKAANDFRSRGREVARLTNKEKYSVIDKKVARTLIMNMFMSKIDVCVSCCWSNYTLANSKSIVCRDGFDLRSNV